MEYLQLANLRDSLELVIKHLRPVNPDIIPISSVGGRISFRNYPVSEDIPAFSRSTMDGYAVKAIDTRGAGQQAPVLLKLAGQIDIKEVPAESCKSGEAYYLPTGAMLPKGADAVVMVEKTEKSGNFLEIYEAVSSGENVILKGEDYTQGQLAVKQGTQIRPQEAGLLAFMGVSEVEVYNRVKVGIFGSGEEVVSVDASPKPPKIRDLNSYTLANLFHLQGFLPFIREILPDEEKVVEDKLREALPYFDALVISGGTSKGIRDVMTTALARLGKPGVVAHGLTIKPGKPTLLGVVNHKPILVLPGHPASCYISARFVALPILRFIAGYMEEPIITTCLAVLGKKIVSRLGFEEYIRVRLVKENNLLRAYPLPGESGLISTLVKADGLVRVAENVESLAEGLQLEVLLL